MEFFQFQENLQKILADNLPSSEAVINDGRAVAKDIQISRTVFMHKTGVGSELDP